MSGDDWASRESLPSSLADELVNPVCERFEAAWNSGKSPRLEDYLIGVQEPQRKWLLRELLLLDLHYRQQRGESPLPEQYQSQFPEDCSVVEAAFQRVSRRLPPLSPTSSDVLLVTLSPGQGSTTRPTRPSNRSSTKRVRCPHCESPIDLADGRSDDVLCPICGNQFLLRDARQTSTSSGMRQLGKFQLLERVGLGAFGAVWRARDTELDRLVALKIPHAGLLQSPSDLERFYREARAAAQLRHPGIVPVHEVATLDGLPAIVSDFIEGVTLRDYIPIRPLTFREAAELVAQVAEAIDYAHATLVHRDIKPANIMLECHPGGGGATSLDHETSDGPETAASAARRSSSSAREAPARRPRPLVMDFGLALRGDGEITLTVDGQIIGTPAYMSPEQAKGRGHRVDRRSDIYSLGVVLYELLCRELPFRGNRQAMLHQVLNEEPRPPRQLNDKVPRDLETICLKAMAKEPGGRYATARELADDLRRFLNGEPIRARPVSSVERLWRWCRRNPSTAGLTAVVAVLVALMAVVATEPVVAGLAIAVATSLVLVAGMATVAAIRLSRMATREHDARSDAEANLVRARNAVDEMLTQVAQRWLTNVPQMESVRQALLEKALVFYEQFLDGRPANPELRKEAARARHRVGDIYAMLGRHGQAKDAYLAAIASLEALAAEFPDESECRHYLAVSYDYLGELLRTTGSNLDEAGRVYRQSLTLLQDLVDRFPDAADYHQELSRTYNNFGILLMDTARAKESEQSFRRAVQLLSDLVKRFSAVAVYRDELARTCINLGVLLKRDADHVTDAEAAFQQAISLLEQLVASYPASRDYCYKLAVSQLDLGNLLFGAATRNQDAETQYRRAAEVLQRLAADYPGIPSYREELANSYNSLGSALANAGRLADAEQMQRQAADQFEQLAGQFSDVPRYQSLLGITLGGLAWVSVERGHLEKARSLVESAIARQQAALSANPDNPEYRRRLREHWAFLAGIHVRDENLDQAMHCLQLAADLGYRNASHLKDNLFDPLRAREDFCRLLSSVERETAQ